MSTAPAGEPKVFWWAKSETMKAVRVMGYRIEGLNESWWCPDVGFTLHVSTHLFENKVDALKELLRQAKLKRDWYEGAIVELTDQIEKGSAS